MKRVLNIAGSLMGLTVFLILVIMLIRILSVLPGKTDLTAQTFQSPVMPADEKSIPSPTPNFPVPEKIPSPLPKSTLTLPPLPPTPTPTSTFTPAPPTPTPEPLPTLIPGLDTLVYATTGENIETGEEYPELYRVQVDKTGQFIDDSV